VVLDVHPDEHDALDRHECGAQDGQMRSPMEGRAGDGVLFVTPVRRRHELPLQRRPHHHAQDRRPRRPHRHQLRRAVSAAGNDLLGRDADDQLHLRSGDQRDRPPTFGLQHHGDQIEVVLDWTRLGIRKPREPAKAAPAV
jgi:hypothetical protein